MRQSQSATVSLSVVVGALIVGGCSSFSGDRQHSSRHHRQESVPPSVATVDVGGNVQKPGSIPITQSGLTLQRALALAGGSRESAQPTNVVARAVDTDTVDKFIDAAQVVGTVRFQVEYMFTRCPDFFPPGKQNDVKERLVGNEADLTNERRKLLESATVASVDRLELISRNVGILQGRLLSPCDDPELTDEELTKQLKEAKDNMEVARRDLVPLQAAKVSESEPTTWLVQLQRASDDGLTRYFFGHEMATTGVAGKLLLNPGDFVQVVAAGTTGLAKNPSSFGGTVALGGVVKQPGLRRLGGTRFSSLTNEIGLNNLRDPVWIVEQPSTSGLATDVFVLPQTLVQSGAGVGALPLQPGAQYTYTSALAVPPVVESVARQLVQSPLTARRRQAESHGERLERQLDQLEANSGDQTSKLLQTVRGLGESLGARIGLR